MSDPPREAVLPRLRRRVALFYNRRVVNEQRTALHWSRLVLVGTIVFMGAALLLTVWITYRGVGNASEALVRGQASVLQADLRGEFRELQATPSEEDLQEILDAYSDSGLRYIALVRRRELIAEAGMSSHEQLDLRPVIRSLRRGEPAKFDGRVRLLLRAPGAARRPRRGGGRPPGPPPVYIEFEPTEAEALLSSSRRTLTVGVGAAVLLLLMAGFLMRWFMRQDKLRAEEENDRRLKSLGQMSAVLAHEIRNPLASLKGNAQILEKLIAKEGFEGSKSAGKAERVVSEANRLETLINDLLNFAKSGELHREATDPGALLHGCVDALPDASVEIDTSGAPTSWSLDHARMQQVLGNLLRNATQASERVEASASASGEQLIFVVRDYGDGIEEGDMEGVFEPFHTKKVHGTGLGLAVAKRLVQLHGGTISASNATGGGAEFRVVIPAG